MNIAYEVLERLVAPHFDPDYYFFSNPELSVVESDPLFHYLNEGWKEGRNPSPYFSTKFYLQNNPDVLSANVEPFYHYILSGQSEGRCIKPAENARDYLSSLEPLNNVTLITMVKNEADIIEVFSRHVSSFFDTIIFIDHMSTDGTFEYLTLLSETDSRFKVFRFENLSYEQSLLMNFALRRLCPKDASWVFFLDVDEFLPFKSKASFLKYLSSCRESLVISFDWLNVVPLYYKDSDFDVNGKCFVPSKPSDYKKIALNLSKLENTDIQISQGAHSVLDKVGDEIDSGEPRYSIFHFPVRSADQFVLKLSQGVASYRLRKGKKSELQGFHWFQMHKLLESYALSDDFLNWTVHTYGQSVGPSVVPYMGKEALLQASYIESDLIFALDPFLPSLSFKKPYSATMFALNVQFTAAQDSAVENTSSTLQLFSGNRIDFVKSDGSFDYHALTQADYPESKLTITSSNDLVSLLYPAFWPIKFLTPTTWGGHIPFMFFLTNFLKPNRYVELGTHHGASFFAICQAVSRLSLKTQCIAIDTWKGDDHTGPYAGHIFENFKYILKSNFTDFASFIRSDFETAAGRFAPSSIDLLHIDGYHTYEAVKNDFTTWLPKLTDTATVLFHDINEHSGDFGVWKFWEEIKAHYPTFEFFHSHGLGVLCVDYSSNQLISLINLVENDIGLRHFVLDFFQNVGSLSSSAFTYSSLKKSYGDNVSQSFEELKRRLAEVTSRLEMAERKG